MNVIQDTSILGQIKTAIIDQAPIKVIELSRAEMDQFLASEEFNMVRSTDSHYGAMVVPVPTKLVTGKTMHNNVPVEKPAVISCYYQGVKIVAPDQTFA